MTELTPATDANQSIPVANEGQASEPIANQSEVVVSEPVKETKSSEPEKSIEQLAREKVKIKHNKAEVEIDPYSDDAKTILSKGMDYDRIRENYDKYQPVVSSIEKIAKEAGYSDVSQYITAAEEMIRQQRLQSLASMDAEQLAQEAYRSRQLEEELKAVKSKYAEQERQDTEFFMFHELFPDVKEAEIPDGVWDSFKKGGSLVDGYRQHRLEVQANEIAELKKQLTIQEQNKANEASAVPSFIGKGVESEVLYSMADIDAMSTEDIAKNWNLIQKSLKKIRGQ